MFEKKFQQEIERQINTTIDYFSYQASSYFDKSVQTISTAENFILSEIDDDKILLLLTEELKDSDSFLSIYFGTPENEMINGSGWIPPESFDLRTRPWYIKAVEENSLITTSLYLNASKDNWIVTFAKPIYSKDGEFLGVLGGDNSLDNILSVIKTQKVSENSYSFFLDSDGSIIMDSRFELTSTNRKESKFLADELLNKFSENKTGVMYTNINDVQGYLGWKKIDKTDWIVGSFTPSSDFTNIKEETRFIIVGIFASFIILYLLIYVYQRKFIVIPLKRLNKDIVKISIENNIDYRLELFKKYAPFNDIRTAINTVLNNTQVFFDNLIETQDELSETNRSLIQSREALIESENKARALVKVFPDMEFIIDSNLMIVDCLSETDIQLGYRKEELIGQVATKILTDDLFEEASKAITTTLRTNKIQQLEYSIKQEKNEVFYEVRMTKLSSNEVLVIIRNITDQRRRQRLIEKLSYKDQLTGLFNRRHYDEQIIKLDRTENLPISIVMIDVNGLKMTNDAFGHLVGDELLINVANLLTSEFGEADLIARIGGDEFVAIFTKANSKSAEDVIQRVYSSTQNKKVNELPISLSIGWGTKTSIQQNISDVFINAEDMMYREKISESQSMHNRSLKLIINTLNEKNIREKMHSERVSKICKNIATEMKLDHETIKTVETAGLLHDVGKIAINDSILNKQGKLTEHEFNEIKKHSEVGYQILKSIHMYSALAEYVLCHHEKWDGTGYPLGKEGEDIPLIARIICVADAYDAMTSDRPYRKALSASEAIQELHSNADKQFDSDIVNALIKLINKKELKL